MKAGDSGQARREVLAVGIAGFGLFFQTIDLAVEDRALKFAEAVVATDDVMLIPDTAGDSAAVVDGAAGFGQLLVVGGNDSAFAGGEVFAGLEGERAYVADGPGEATFERSAVSVGGVFDDGQAVLFGDGYDRIHVGHLPGEVDGDDGFGA